MNCFLSVQLKRYSCGVIASPPAGRAGRVFCAVLMVAVVSFLFCSSLQASSAEFSSAQPRLNGTYIQLNAAYSNWRVADWERLFQSFKQMRLSHVVVQWTVNDAEDFISKPNAALGGASVMDTIFNLAEFSGIRVFVGLVYRSDYWTKIEKEPGTKKDFLSKLLKESIQTADVISSRFGARSSFYGWYITEEIDDINWADPQSRQILKDYLKSLSAHLRSLSVSKAIALSGFSNAVMTPRQLKMFWLEILEETKVDTVFFQDGIGVNKLQLNNLPRYLDAMREASLKSSCQLEVVVEIFSQTDGPPINDGNFAAVPASLKRIKHQLSIARKYSPNIIAFSVPEYLSPDGGSLANKLYNDYLKAMGFSTNEIISNSTRF